MYFTVYRRGVAIERCSTLADISRTLGFARWAMGKYKASYPKIFPNPVAKVGPVEIYIIEEVEAFYQSRQWARSDAQMERMYKGVI